MGILQLSPFPGVAGQHIKRKMIKFLNGNIRIKAVLFEV